MEAKTEKNQVKKTLAQMKAAKPSIDLIRAYIENRFAVVPFRITDYDENENKWIKDTLYPWKKVGAKTNTNGLEQWYEKWFIENDYSLISAVAEKSGLLVIDYDDYKKGGAEGKQVFIDKYNPPDTLTVTSLNGGTHHYFLTDEETVRALGAEENTDIIGAGNIISVSYTHLTLPTSDLV